MDNRIKVASLLCAAVVVIDPHPPRAAEAGPEVSPWYAGEEVVCVNNRFLEFSDAPELVEGRVYTIRDVWPPRRGHIGLQVFEVDAKAKFRAFDERRFELRPWTVRNTPAPGARHVVRFDLFRLPPERQTRL